MKFVLQSSEKTPAAKYVTNTPASKKSNASTLEMNSFALLIRKTFVFSKKDDEETGEGEALGKSLVTMSEAFKKYVEVGVIKKVYFDSKKLLEFHENGENAPDKCGQGILSLWNQYEKMLNEKKQALERIKKQLSSSKKQGKCKSEESSESLCSSPRIVAKQRKYSKSMKDEKNLF